MLPLGTKLIRDRILTIIQERGEPVPAHGRLDSDLEFRQALEEKLIEELEELLNARGHKERMNELVDLREVLDAMVELESPSVMEFSDLLTRKRRERGAFRERLVAQFPLPTCRGHVKLFTVNLMERHWDEMKADQTRRESAIADTHPLKTRQP